MDCYLQVPDDFEERYVKYREGLLEDEPQKTNPIPVGNNVAPPIGGNINNGHPFTYTEGSNGFFKFYKEGPKIKIGGKTTRPFLLLQCLCDPSFGIEKAVEQVFEAIQIPSDANNRSLQKWSQNRDASMVRIIKNSAIKQLQKIKELQGKLFYKFSPGEKQLQLQLEE
jgi:hypothetical protein